MVARGGNCPDGGLIHGRRSKDGHRARAHPDAGTGRLRGQSGEPIGTGRLSLVRPSPGGGASSTATDLSVIACATDDPEGVGELTGAWRGDEGGVYYIRQVGDCVWWFGTEIDDIEPGVTGQGGFANVASGRMVGSQIDRP